MRITWETFGVRAGAQQETCASLEAELAMLVGQLIDTDTARAFRTEWEVRPATSLYSCSQMLHRHIKAHEYHMNLAVPKCVFCGRGTSTSRTGSRTPSQKETTAQLVGEVCPIVRKSQCSQTLGFCLTQLL
jgi:hypothetical protein